MKRTSTILAAFLLLLCASTWVSAQVLLTENFNYTATDSLTTHGWSAHSGAGTNVETITTGLTYTGFIGSGIGGASTLATTGQDVNKTWVSYPNGIISGTVYYSVLVNLDSAQTAGDYFFHLYKNSSTFTARLFAKKAFTSNNFSFGIARSSTTANIAYTDSIYTFGTTYLIVVKYSIIAGAANDTVAMWINPNIAGTEPAPTILETSADKTTADVDTIYGVAIRQGTVGNAPRGKVDGIRVVGSWKSINNKLAVLSKNSISFSNITLGGNATDSVIVKNDDATSITISSVTSGAAVLGVSPTSATIASGASQKFVVTYTPVATVTTSSAIVFISDAQSSPDSVFITANAIVPGFTISKKIDGFGNVYKDSTKIDSVTVTNALAASSLVIDSVTSSNPVFTVGPANATLAVSATQKFGVLFKPTAAGVQSSFIVFHNNGGLLRDTLRVSGNGIIKAPLISLTPTLKDFHGVLVNHAWKDSITVKNTGYDSLFITNVVSSDPSFTVTPATARLDSQASKKFFITFTPTSVGVKSGLVTFSSNTTDAKDTVVGSGITFVTIAEARKDLNGDLIADHTVTKDTLAIYGVITTPNMGASASQSSFFMQDSTGGIDAFAFGVPPTTYAKGDSVLVIGTAAQFRGLVEFTPVTLDTLHFQILKHNATFPKPKHLTAHQFAINAESYEGQLIELDSLYKASGTWPAALIGNVSIFLTNASHVDTVQMFLDVDAGIGGSTEPTYPIHVIGTVSQFSSATTVYNNGYEIVPRDSLDITKTKLAQYTKISEARKDANADLIPDHSVTGDTLLIYGVVTSLNFQASGNQTAYFVQDSTGGVEVFAASLPPTSFAMGDSVYVVGKVNQFRGLTEFVPIVNDSAHFWFLKHNAKVPAAKRLTLHQYVLNAENYEGMLIEIDTLYKASGTWPAAAANASIFVTNASKADTAQMFIDLDTDIDGTPELVYPINVVGVGSQFSSATGVNNNGYEIIPRDTFDIHHQSVVFVKDPYSGIPTVYELQNNYPNPFNPSTTILYGLPQQSHVTVTIYSVLGQELATLVNEVQGPNYYRVVWNGKDKNGGHVSSGVYFFRMVAQSTDGNGQSFVQVKKMLMMK